MTDTANEAAELYNQAGIGKDSAWDEYDISEFIAPHTYTGRYRRLSARQVKAMRAMAKLEERGAQTDMAIEVALAAIEELTRDGVDVDPLDIALDDLMSLYMDHPFLKGARRGPGDQGDSPDPRGGPPAPAADPPDGNGAVDGVDAGPAP